jgi:hypothetical protein
MKKILSAIFAMACTASLSQAQPDTLTGVLAIDETLDTNTCYVLKDCYVVPSGRTLTISPGVKVLAMNDAILVVEPGGRIEATGLANNPIVFTSAQAQGFRTAGYWYGIAVGSDAPINKTIPTMSQCRTEVPGGSNPTGSSGWLKYVQIHYAGKADITNDKRLEAGLSLMAVGSGTEIENIQVTNSATNGINFVGGTVNARELYLLDNYRNSVFFTDGHTGMVQSVLTQTVNPVAHHTAGTHGMYFQNNEDADGSTPLTQPTISNATLLGPLYCDPEAIVSSDFGSGIYFNNNGGANIYNSVIAGFNEYGLYIEDSPSAERTRLNTLNASNNSYTYNILGDYNHGSFPWTSSNMCGNSMTAWLTPVLFTSCEETGNQLSTIFLAYDGSICTDFCDTEFTPNFVVDALNTALASPDYDIMGNFEELEFRGAVQSTDWLGDWVSYCPLDANYCNTRERKNNINSISLPLKFTPNPAAKYTMLEFESLEIGAVNIYLLDKVSGSICISHSYKIIEPGMQRLTLPLSSLKDGVYTVKVVIGRHIRHGLLVVSQ